MTKSSESEDGQIPDQLLQNYKPLALKAVLAGCAIKCEPLKPVVSDLESFGPLPEGFHVLSAIDD